MDGLTTSTSIRVPNAENIAKYWYQVIRGFFKSKKKNLKKKSKIRFGFGFVFFLFLGSSRMFVLDLFSQGK